MLEQNFRRVVPYTPGTQPRFEDMIKLNTNENPYPPAPSVVEAAKNSATDAYRLYPPTDAGALRRELADYHRVKAENVFVGVGSDDVLSVIFQSLFASGKPLLFPDISYSFYEVWAALYNLPFEMIPLKEDFTIDPADYNRDCGGIVIANPNAPTAISLEKSKVEQIIASHKDVLVVIDEAYVDFGGESVIDLIDRYENLVVVRTFSKSRSMAGMRIGYAIASERVIKALDDVKFAINSYTMNRAAIETGVASIKDEKYFRDCLKKLIATRDRMVKELEELGFKCLPSSANFIFATKPGFSADVLFTELEKKHIFVRHFNKPRISEYLRITVGTEEQVDSLIKAIKEILSRR